MNSVFFFFFPRLLDGNIIRQTLTTVVSNTNTATSSTSTTTTPTSTTAIPTLTPAPVQQGPVGQPAPTVGQPGGVTPYTYTTIVGGVTQVLTDNFTPTNPPTLSPTIPTTGSVMPYSVWLSMYGSQATASSKSYGERLMAWCPEHLVSLAVALAVTTLLS